jgi:hypothetical protein
MVLKILRSLNYKSMEKLKERILTNRNNISKIREQNGDLTEIFVQNNIKITFLK